MFVGRLLCGLQQLLVLRYVQIDVVGGGFIFSIRIQHLQGSGAEVNACMDEEARRSIRGSLAIHPRSIHRHASGRRKWPSN